MISTETRIQKLLAVHLGVDDDKVIPGATLDDLGADSLDAIEIVMTVEQEFEIEITDAVSENWKTVQDIITCVDLALESVRA